MNLRIWVVGLVLAAVGVPARAENAGDSVVKVYATQRGPDMMRPWAKSNPSESVGSGVVIEGNQILTNAHVVLYATDIAVQGKEGGDKVDAKIKFMEPGIDLAVLTVDDKAFFAKRPALARAKKMPQERDPVEVYGYPFGGTSQSVTKGVVSRIEFVPYNSTTLGVRVQIDAALNPGNSGGPAVVGNEMIGIAFSRFAFGQASNIGYIIPNEEVESFLKDPTPRPRLTASLQPLQNEMLRKKLGLDDKMQGLLVCQPSEPLQKLDILTHIGDHALDNQGQVQVGDNLHFEYDYVVPHVVKDGKIPVTVVRDGKELHLDVPVSKGEEQLLRDLNGQYPKYFVYGPLVFGAAGIESVGILARMGNFDLKSPMLLRAKDKVQFAGEELVVVMCPMFHHKCVRGYNDPVGRVVEDVNGIKIKNLRHLVEVLRDCKDDYVTFGFAGDHAEVFVLNRKDMAGVTKEIMNDNAVPSTGSPDLVALWENGQDKKVSVQEEQNEAEKLFHVMEQRLVEAKDVKVEFEGTLKTGKAEQQQKGTFLLAEKNKAHIELTLDVGGKPKTIKIVSDGKGVKYFGDEDSVLQREVTRDFNARIVGRLSQAGLVGLDLPPRRVDEPRVYNFEMAAPERLDDREPQVIRYRFRQQGTPAMSVTLWLDAKTHFPLKRVMTIEAGPRFEENYRITVGEKVDDSEFELSGKAE